MITAKPRTKRPIAEQLKQAIAFLEHCGAGEHIAAIDVGFEGDVSFQMHRECRDAFSGCPATVEGGRWTVLVGNIEFWWVEPEPGLKRSEIVR